MKKQFRVILWSVIFLLSVATISSINAAEPWKPSGAITVILQVAAGGSGDLEVKALQKSMEEQLGVGIVTVYETAGGGTVAALQVARAKADGRTLLYTNDPATTIKELTADAATFKVLEDFVYLTNVATEYRVIAARPNLPYKTFKDLVDYCKSGKKPTIAHSGVGSSGHLQILQVENAAGIDLNDVPFTGNSTAKAAFLGGHVDLWAIDLVNALAQVNAGECVILGYCGEKRNPLIPDVPTLKELGYNVIASTSRGFIAPKGLPDNIKARLIEVIENATKADGMLAYAKTSKLNLNVVSGNDYFNMVKDMYNVVKGFVHLFK